MEERSADAPLPEPDPDPNPNPDAVGGSACACLGTGGTAGATVALYGTLVVIPPPPPSLLSPSPELMVRDLPLRCRPNSVDMDGVCVLYQMAVMVGDSRLQA